MASRSSPGKSNPSLDPALPQKKRARRRLVGAAAVCLAAAIVLPLILDSEPRQMRDDVQVRIPSRDTPLPDRNEPDARSGVIKPLTGADAAGASAGAERNDSSQPSAQADRNPAAADDARSAKADAAGAAGRNAAVPEPPAREPEPEPAARAATKQAPPAPANDPIARLAQAKDDTSAKDSSAAKVDGYLVQIGAFSSAKGAAEQADRARKAGYKSFTEKVSTGQGERIRVRVGPFRTRDAAEQARTKLRAAGIESVLVAP
jgi:DedD protein